MLTLGNKNEQDANENGWPSRCCYIDGYLCCVLFLDVFSLILFFRKGQLIAKSAMIVVFFAVNTLPIALSAFRVCMFQRGT